MKFIKLQNFFSILAHLSKREKLILYGAIVFISLAFLDRMVISVASSKIKSLDKEIETKESEIKNYLKILAQKNRIEIQRANYSSYLGSEKSENEEVTVFLKEIESLANKAEIYLIDMKPAGIKDQGSSKKFLVNLNCEGEMKQIAVFMYTIETSNKLLTIDKYQISPKSKDSSLAKCSMVISKLVIP
jgi:Tfp pilus assembly protein PilO